MPTIRASHHCFDDAAEFISERVTRDPALAHGTTLRLVHGIVLGPRDAAGDAERAAVGCDDGLTADEPFAHAWLEEESADGVLVWQSGVLDGGRVYFAVAREEFAAVMRPQASTVYTLCEVWRENNRSGHVGPWRAEYRALCRDRRI